MDTNCKKKTSMTKVGRDRKIKTSNRKRLIKLASSKDNDLNNQSTNLDANDGVQVIPCVMPMKWH